ncbi:MAG: OsmC family protein [Candidatus Rokuibacteriota bacterium]
MNRDELRARQAPLKQRYRDDPGAALVTLKAEARLGDGVSCSVATGRALVEAGLHPATGGTGMLACSGDMLLQALVACAGVTLSAVATSLGIEVRGGQLSAEGDLDFRGTLGVARDTPVGFRQIRLSITIDSDAGPEDRRKLLELTERYCVVHQTLRNSPELTVTYRG